MKIRLAIVVAAIVALSAIAAAPASAHDCFNPTKQPTAGVNWELTGFDSNGNPILVQIGPGSGNGGFVEIAAGVFGNPVPLYTHSLGSGMNPHGVVGGPGSQKPNHACDGKGIDYLDVCFGGG
jgi:hypothetical protein